MKNKLVADCNGNIQLKDYVKLHKWSSLKKLERYHFKIDNMSRGWKKRNLNNVANLQNLLNDLDIIRKHKINYKGPPRELCDSAMRLVDKMLEKYENS